MRLQELYQTMQREKGKGLFWYSIGAASVPIGASMLLKAGATEQNGWLIGAVSMALLGMSAFYISDKHDRMLTSINQGFDGESEKQREIANAKSLTQRAAIAAGFLTIASGIALQPLFSPHIAPTPEGVFLLTSAVGSIGLGIYGKVKQNTLEDMPLEVFPRQKQSLRRRIGL